MLFYDYNKIIPLGNSQIRLHISPEKNIPGQQSNFLTTPKEKTSKISKSNIIPREIFPLNANYKSLLGETKANKTAFTSKTSLNDKISIDNINQKKTLILDIDETLVHSAFKPFNRPSDISLNIDINGLNRKIYVLKRPHVDEFLEELSNIFEIITFTASLSQYADPLLDKLDKYHIVSHRLFRENCIYLKGMYIKDLRKIGRELKNIIIIDNNPISYVINMDNGIPILTWYENLNDDELMKLIPLLKYLASVEDVRPVIKQIVNRKINKIDFNMFNQIVKGDKDKKTLRINSGYKPANNKSINYSMISKNITNSLSNMSYNDYLKNLENNKNSKSKTNSIIKLNNKNDNSENNQISKVNKEKMKINFSNSKINEQIKYNIINKKENLRVKINNYINKKKINKNINNKTNSNININNNNFNKNNLNNNTVNDYNKIENLRNILKNNVKAISNNDLINKNKTINNKMSLNNHFSKNIIKRNNINDINKINTIATPTNYPKDNSRPSQEKDLKIIHPQNSGCPQDSNTKKDSNKWKLIKFNSKMRKKNKNKTVNYSQDQNINKNINNSLPNNITVNNVNFNNEMFINIEIGSLTPKKEENKNRSSKSKKVSGTEELNRKQKYLKKYDKCSDNGKNKENDLNSNKIENISVMNDEKKKNNKKKIENQINQIEINNNISNLKNNNINNKKTENILIENNGNNKIIKKGNKIIRIIKKNNKKKNLNKKINTKKPIVDNNNKKYDENISININQNNQFFYHVKRFTNENLFKYRPNSPNSYIYEQINEDYKKYFNKPNKNVKENTLNQYVKFENNRASYNNNLDNFYQQGSINLLYRNNLTNLKNYNMNSYDYIQSLNQYNYYISNNENSYLYNN